MKLDFQGYSVYMFYVTLAIENILVKNIDFDYCCSDR